MWVLGSILLEEAEILEPRDQGFARREALHAVELLRQRRGAFRQPVQVVRIVRQRQPRFLIENADLRQRMTPSDLEIVEVVRRRDLDRAAALFRIRIGVGDDRDAPSDQRQDDVLADQVAIAFVVGMHRDGAVAQHGFRPRGRHHDEACGILRIERVPLQRIAQVPQAALDFDLLNLEVGNCRQQFRIPVDQPLVLVDQALTMQFDEHLHDRARQALVHRETLARPIA